MVSKPRDLLIETMGLVTCNLDGDLQERCRILGLELYSCRSFARVSSALDAYGREKDSSIVQRCIASGFVGQLVKATELQVHALSAIRDRLASSLNASSSTRGGANQTSAKGPAGVPVLGKTRPRAHALVAQEQLDSWLEQLSASLDSLRVR